MIITLDFETFYDSEYTLKKLSTEEYIRDPRFETIGVGISVNGAPAQWYAGTSVGPILRSLPWDKAALLAYHTPFDGAILAWHYGIYPALYLDAMGMARALNKTFRGGRLETVAMRMGVGIKGDYVVQAKGKRFLDFTPFELEQYGGYCCNDVNLTVALYKLFKPDFPLSEIKVQDQNIRIFTQPALLFDVPVLQTHLENVIDNKQKYMVKAAQTLGLMDHNEQQLKTALASNLQFAALLRSLGVEPPVKLSPANGKETYAFAKTDEAFIELLEHPDSAVQAVVAARLGVRSTIEETRAQRFLDIARRGAWPVQYTYYSATTGRFGGAGNANPQNLKRGGKLRDSILPPPGHLLIPADLGQIECRILNYLAEQDDIVNAFRLHDQNLGPDVYCILAEKIYRKTITPQDKDERMIGKVGELQLGYGGGKKSLKRSVFSYTGKSMPEHECQGIVDVYRKSHRNVESLWYRGNDVLRCMMRGGRVDFGRPGLLNTDMLSTKGIGLPSGLYLQFPELRQESDDTGDVSFVYTKNGKPERIWGATAVQWVCEALARLVLVEAWLRISERIRIVLHTHDELVGMVPEADASWAVEFMRQEMTQPVPWAPGLPLACEAKAGRSYGEAKR